MSVHVILDTNFVMIPGKEGLDVFRKIRDALYKPVRFYVCSGTLMELEKLKTSGKGADKRAAKLALTLLQDAEVIETNNQHVDDALVELSGQGYLVATQDLGLKRRLGRYLYMRQKKFIEIRGTTD